QVNSTSKLELGDLIFYKNRKGRIQHSAIITSFNGNYPLISQHTPDLLDIPYEKSWADRIYFIKIYL
ncbi:MAG TPA: methylase, partial [Clostridium sp.]|nr:methylase [Clostridium sp.]